MRSYTSSLTGRWQPTIGAARLYNACAGSMQSELLLRLLHVSHATTSWYDGLRTLIRERTDSHAAI